MITIVMPYYDNGGMLERHLQEWQTYAPEVKEQFRAVIVDDGSPSDPAVDHIKDPAFHVELYRIKQNIPWNTPGARNLGMHAAPDGWCLLTDIDHLLDASQAEKLAGELTLAIKDIEKIDGASLRGAYWTFGRKWADGRTLNSHPNTYLLQRWLYWEVGGTDEDFAKYWGAGEGPFRKVLQAYGWPLDQSNIYLTHFGRDDIADASTREWGRKGSPYDYNNNPELVKKARGPAYKPVNPLRFEWEKVL